MKWERLANPKHVSGVGDTVKICTHQVILPSRLENGEMIKYATPVIKDDSTPGLYGVDSMSADNTYFGTRKGIMAMIPEGTDDQIQWPRGTRFVNCNKAPSGHWIMQTNNFKRGKTKFDLANSDTNNPYAHDLRFERHASFPISLDLELSKTEFRSKEIGTMTDAPEPEQYAAPTYNKDPGNTLAIVPFQTQTTQKK